MKSVLKVTQLQFLKRFSAFLMPIILLAGVAAVTVLVHLVLARSGIVIEGPGYEQGNGAQFNSSVVWALGGFLVYLGVASVSMTFPFALSLGSTRRSFTLGTFLYHMGQSAYLAGLIMVLLAIETATGHWFSDIRIFDVQVLGMGNVLLAGAIAFLGTLTFLSIGSGFGAVWLRYGAKGPIAVALVVVILLVGLLLILAPYFGQIFANFQMWWLAMLAAAVIVVSMLGQYTGLRRANIR